MSSSLIKKTDLTVVRMGTDGYYDADGNWVGDATSNIAIKCNIQPFRMGRESITLPDGYRQEDIQIVYTETELFTDDEKIMRSADQTTIDGQDYKCIAVEKWRYTSLSHFKCFFARIDKTG